MFQILNLLIGNPLLGLAFIGAIILAIGLHEAAHAYSAYWLGDNTPKFQGRLTLNPINHLDPIGTLLIIIVGFGWGRAVEFNPYNLKNAKRDIALVAFAGPAMNILLAIICSLIVNSGVLPIVLGSDLYLQSLPIIVLFAQLNITLAVFNLIPVEPLDGFKVLAGLLPNHLANQWYQTRQYGVYVLIVILITGAVEKIVFPITTFLFNLIFFLRF